MRELQKPVVVFDIDDTLYPEFDYIRSGIVQAFPQLGVSCAPEAFLYTFATRYGRGDRKELIQSTAADLGVALQPEKLAAFLHIYRNQLPQIALSPEVEATLARLKEGGIALAAISDGDAHRQNRKVAALKLRQWLDPVVLTGALPGQIDKTSPVPFKLIEAHFGDGHRFVYIADNSVKDFIHPSRLGWQMIQIQRPERVHLTPPAPNTIVVLDEQSMLSAVHQFVAGEI